MKYFTLLLLATLTIAQAEHAELTLPEAGTNLPLWTPDDDPPPNQKWPVIIYYHGTNGRPTIGLIKSATQGKHFLLVGMTYAQQGRFQQTKESIAAELALLKPLKTKLVNEHAADPSRIYVAGFSKGGWFTSLLLERDRTLAGGLVLGAGVFHGRSEPDVKPFATKKPIYLGVGRNDGNYPQSLRALVHFRKLGANVTLEAWPETGHAYPKASPTGITQWLALQAGAHAEAKPWITQRMTEIQSIKDPVDQWYAWKDLQEAPFTKAFGKEASPVIDTHITKLLAHPKVATEKSWEDQSRDILRREIKDRFVPTLESVTKRYAELAEKAKGTRAGRIAADDAKRTASMLKAARGN